MVTSFLPQASVAWNPSTAFGASLAYAPEITVYHAASAENYFANRATLTLGGKNDSFAYESTTSLVWINGSSVGPTWTGPGGAPATGGPAVRDRRDAAVYRTSLRFTEGFGKWLVRPVFSLYVHDFQTEHRSTAGYQNYVDRNEFLGGGDLGRRLTDKLTLWAGYRYGVQGQAQLLAYPEQYDSTFQRVLGGIEGQPVSWLRTMISIGPEFRHFGDKVPVTFGDHYRLNLFVDGSVTVTPSKMDSIVLSIKQFEQPGFSGKSVYQDLTYDVSWKRKLDDRWNAGVGFRAYNTDFLRPVVRNDWVLSDSIFLNCAITAHLNGELSYVYETGLTHDLHVSAREYSRHLLSLGIRYLFL